MLPLQPALNATGSHFLNAYTFTFGQLLQADPVQRLSGLRQIALHDEGGGFLSHQVNLALLCTYRSL